MDTVHPTAVIESSITSSYNIFQNSSPTALLPSGEYSYNQSLAARVTTLNTSTTDYACAAVMDHKAVSVSHTIFIVFSIIFVVVGIIGNGISILVFSSKSMRVVSSNVYLWVLSVSDTCYLITVFFSKILPVVRCMHFKDSTFDVINRSNLLCKILQYFLDLFSDYSTCLILAFTIERFFACYHAVWFRQMCTVLRARIFCLAIFVTICIFIAPYHALFIGLYKHYDVCTVLVEAEKKFTIMYIVEAMAFRIVPVFIIAVLNLLIISKVTKLSRQRSRRRSGAIINNKPYGFIPTKEDRHIQLTTLLLIVSTCYIILYFPVLIHFLIWWLHRLEVLYLTEESLIVSQNYTKILYILGFAINFFLYTLSGKVFRDQLNCIMCGPKKIYQEINNMTLEETTANVTHVHPSPNNLSTKV